MLNTENIQSLIDSGEGYNVEFDELGYFSTTLKCTRPAMNKNRIRTVRNGKVPSKQRI